MPRPTHCAHCGNPIPLEKRNIARYCSRPCKEAAFRQRWKAETGVAYQTAMGWRAVRQAGEEPQP